MAILGAAAFGSLALYSMINPAKASYSIAPTMVICAAVGFLTAKLFRRGDQQSQLLITALLGLSVNFRIPNLLLSAGYGICFLVASGVVRNARTFLQSALFGAACPVGIMPTLIANAINAGSSYATTYGPGDVMPPDLTFSIIGGGATMTCDADDWDSKAFRFKNSHRRLASIERWPFATAN